MRRYSLFESRTRTIREEGQPFFRGLEQSGPGWTGLPSTGRRLEADVKSGTIDPLKALRGALQNDTQDLELVRACLTYYEEIQLTAMGQRERLATIRADNVGGIALNWLWKDTQRWSQTLPAKQTVQATIHSSLGMMTSSLQRRESAVRSLATSGRRSIWQGYLGVVVQGNERLVALELGEVLSRHAYSVIGARACAESDWQRVEEWLAIAVGDGDDSPQVRICSERA